MTHRAYAGNGHMMNGRQYFHGAADLVDSIMELGKAATRFTFVQMETALCMVSEPSRAIHRIRQSIDSFVHAMNQPPEEGAHGASSWFTEKQPETGEHFTGRKV
jgi:hypothetical protein